MILDITVVVIVLGTMIRGYRHGLVSAFIRTAGWLLALALGFIFSPMVKSFILDNTLFYDNIYNNINEKVGTFLTPDQLQADLPTIIQNPFLSFTESLSGSIAESLSDFIVTVLCFLIVTIIVNFILRLVMGVFSKERNNGITGFLDGSRGMLFGFVKGIIYVFVFLAFMFPITSLANPDIMNALAESLSNSHIAMELYHNNPVLLIVRDIL